jgi:hypothetical protein
MIRSGRIRPTGRKRAGSVESGGGLGDRGSDRLRPWRDDPDRCGASRRRPRPDVYHGTGRHRNDSDDRHTGDGRFGADRCVDNDHRHEPANDDHDRPLLATVHFADHGDHADRSGPAGQHEHDGP